MTIEREEPGVWRATCDGCGDAITLDADPDDQEEADDELEALGWRARPVDTVKFDTDLGDRKFKVEYREHDCPDCI